MRKSAFALAFAGLTLLTTSCFLIYGRRVPLELPALPQPLVELNTPFDDYNAAAPDTAYDILIFSSNRGGSFDLYRTTLRFAGSSYEASPPEPHAPELMSDADELGPFLGQEVLTFASDRPGGAGGFDLYRHAPSAALGPVSDLNSAADDMYWTAPDSGGVGAVRFQSSGPLRYLPRERELDHDRNPAFT